MPKVICEGLTFDDVVIQPGYADFLPEDAVIDTYFSRNIPCKLPISSSAMDTVTDHRLAIVLAREGGIGVIHRRFSIEDERREVELVKRSQAAKIIHPYTLLPANTVGQARSLMNEKGISGVPIVESDGTLVGIITRRDLDLEGQTQTLVSEVMTGRDHLVTAPSTVSLEDARKIFFRTHVEKLPLVDESFRLRGLITRKDMENRVIFPNATRDNFGQLRVGAAIGVKGDFLERAQELLRAGVDVIVVDVAHGHSANVGAAVDALKKVQGMVDVVAGNVVTAKGARFLLNHGADGVKVGIGASPICTTRIAAGCGAPQITAIMDVADDVADEVPVIADGGIRYPGDVTKAIAAGARMVMMGTGLAGTDESPGDIVIINGQRYKAVWGMGSVKVMRSGGDRYDGKMIPEGVEGLAPYSGRLVDVLRRFEGGLRAGMGYAGCKTIPELQQANFIRNTQAGIIEAHPGRDITDIKEEPFSDKIAD